MVKAWHENVIIPTYEVGKPEKNPIFLEKRVYQGSSGVVYPYPVIESMADEKIDKTYDAIYIENEYIKVMILPELGGRVQMAYDKIRQRHFIYYNQVIKPALVGLMGPWISGGIEFNWPQHHRPSTFMPVDCKIIAPGQEADQTRVVESEDEITVWVNERERMFHQQGQAGFTLRSGCAYLEIKGRLYNPTEVPQTFLWWANPAVEVNDQYQSVFPPDVNAVFDHGKRAVSSFPIATGTYYKMDYSAGVDISNYRNIFVPTSYMVAKSKYNFEGGYENDTQAGMLHIADHHFAPGKKQWTWGNGDFGRAWDRNLTDEEQPGDLPAGVPPLDHSKQMNAFRPYIELMAGVYTENQPDFTWLMPYEEKSFVQYFLPYRELGLVKNASKDLLLNIEQGCLKVFATSRQEIQIVVKNGKGETIFDETDVLSPEEVYVRQLNTSHNDLQVQLISKGRCVLDYAPEPDEITPIPDAAEAALKPQDIKTNEQLFLTGLHLEQYRHATWSALDYYEEALRRDPLDVRCNNAIGLWFIRRGRFAKAETYLRTAVKVLQRRNLNPYDGEPLYNLGLALKYQGKLDEAFDWFYKSTWNAAWQQAGYMACAQIATSRGDYEEALSLIEKSLLSGWHNHKARALKTALLKRLGKETETQKWATESLDVNAFNYGVLFETDRIDEMKQLMRHDANNYDELALDYCGAGLWLDAVALWEIAIAEDATTPLTRYYMAWAQREGNASNHIVKATLQDALAQSPDFCFPNRSEAVLALQSAIEIASDDAHAPYFLGNLYYNAHQYDLALKYWEMSAQLDSNYPTVHRNLALLYMNKPEVLADASGHEQQALDEMKLAYKLDETDSRILMELDQLYKRLQYAPSDRLAFLKAHPSEVQQRDDLILEFATLLNQTGQYEEAKQLIDQHTFHPWEGGEGKVSGQYQISRLEIAKQLIAEKREIPRAIELLRECLYFPDNLGEGKLYGAQDNDFYYYLGLAYSMQGKQTEAIEAWTAGTAGPTEPAAALYYNDAKPDKIYYAALCYHQLGMEDKARGLFHKLIAYGEKHLFEHVTMDYFAVSLPDLLVWEGDLDQANQIHCHYMLALGHIGLGNMEKGKQYLQKVLAQNINHTGALALQNALG